MQRSVGASAANPQGQIPASRFSIGSITCAASGGNSSPSRLRAQAAPSLQAAELGLCSAPAGHSAGTFKIGTTYVLHVPEGIYTGQYKATVEYLAF